MVHAFLGWQLLTVYSSGAGNHYGTFSGPINAFSPVSKGKKAADSPGKNFLTNPPKKGTGYGYLHVTIGASPKYMSDAYERARELRKVIGWCIHADTSKNKIELSIKLNIT